MGASYDPRKAQALIQALRMQSMPTPSATLSEDNGPAPMPPGPPTHGLQRPPMRPMTTDLQQVDSGLTPVRYAPPRR